MSGLIINNDNTKEVVAALHAATRKALVESGELVLTSAVAKCPVDTGNLRNSLNLKMHGDDTVEIGSTGVEYAIFVECGTRRLKHPPSFLVPSVKLNMNAIEAIFKKNLS